jgi:hypothetical protein
MPQDSVGLLNWSTDCDRRNLDPKGWDEFPRVIEALQVSALRVLALCRVKPGLSARSGPVVRRAD